MKRNQLPNWKTITHAVSSCQYTLITRKSSIEVTPFTANLNISLDDFLLNTKQRLVVWSCWRSQRCTPGSVFEAIVDVFYEDDEMEMMWVIENLRKRVPIDTLQYSWFHDFEPDPLWRHDFGSHLSAELLQDMFGCFKNYPHTADSLKRLFLNVWTRFDTSLASCQDNIEAIDWWERKVVCLRSRLFCKARLAW